jgi:hypothetical protein
MNTFYYRTLSILVMSGVLVTGTAFAQQEVGNQDWRGGPPSVEQKLAHLSDALGLSNQQSVDMLIVLQQAAEGREDLHAQNMALMGPEICAQRLETEEAVLAILTAEQIERLEQIKEERENDASRKGRRGGGRGELDCSG